MYSLFCQCEDSHSMNFRCFSYPRGRIDESIVVKFYPMGEFRAAKIGCKTLKKLSKSKKWQLVIKETIVLLTNNCKGKMITVSEQPARLLCSASHCTT